MKQEIRYSVPWLLLAICGLFFVVPLSAQTPSSHVVITQGQDNTLGIQTITNGVVTPLSTLSDSFRINYDLDTTHWTIQEPSSIVVSPTGQYVAFTANRDTMSALFVYSLSTDVLIQVDLLEPMIPLSWSPHGQLLLLYACCESSSNPYADYVYNSQTNILTRLAERFGSTTLWLPDSSNIIAFGRPFIFVRDVTTGDIVMLADLTPYLSEQNAYRNVCDLTWSQATQKYYFVIGCSAGEEPQEFLYSVNLAGNVKKETPQSMDLVFSEDSYVSVTRIHPVSDSTDVYLTLASRSPRDEEAGSTTWRIIKVSESGDIDEVYVFFSDDTLMESIISPDENHLLMTSYPNSDSNDGIMKVVDLQTGMALDTSSVPYEVCQAVWLNNTNVLYSVDSTQNCAGAKYGAPQTLWTLDLETMTTQEITPPNSLGVWLIPMPVGNPPPSP